MPRQSLRQQLLKVVTQQIHKRKILDLLNDGSDSDDDSLDSSDSFEEYMTHLLEEIRESVTSTRYLKRDTYRTSTDYIFDRDLRTEPYSDGTPPWLTEEEFINKYRMCRHSSHLLVQKLRPILCLRTKKEDDTCLPSTYGVSFLFG